MLNLKVFLCQKQSKGLQNEISIKIINSDDVVMFSFQFIFLLSYCKFKQSQQIQNIL